MAFQLPDVVPWGRSFDEYIAMFALTDEDLARSILGCGDGPASFNAGLTRRGGRVVSADPIYRLSAQEIESKIREVAPVVLEQARANAHLLVWTHITSVDELGRIRMSAMREFLADYAAVANSDRYVDASLPALPFEDGHFDLALCSHFLFLYSEQNTADFHRDSLRELCRVAREVRVFPVLELNGQRSRHLEVTAASLVDRGFDVALRQVDYEFQRGGNQMFVVTPRSVSRESLRGS